MRRYHNKVVYLKGYYRTLEAAMAALNELNEELAQIPKNPRKPRKKGAS